MHKDGRVLDGHLAGFLSYLRVERGLAENTLEAYRRDLQQYLKFLSARKIQSPAEIKGGHITAYLMQLQKEGRRPATMARRLSAVRTFLKFLVAEGFVVSNPAADLGSPKPIHRLPRVLGVDEIEKLLQAPDTANPLGLRDRALLELLYATGLRVSEAVDLLVGDLDPAAGLLRCLGKGRKERMVPVGEQALWMVGLC